MEDRASSQAQAAPPDYTAPAFQKAADLQRTGDTDGARGAWMDFIRNYPESSKITEAKAALGGINASQLLSNSKSPEKTIIRSAKAIRRQDASNLRATRRSFFTQQPANDQP
jgi:TolA-binding protein